MNSEKITYEEIKYVKLVSVESVGKGNVNTVEGNSVDKVKRCSYPIGDSEIYGYGTLVT